ncbi:MAG TPA: hypothetical protein VJO99_06230 [Burkholderiaceae bacterium]|nr:hypothetical protein [Burkholderiaceae bacterium]
MSTSGIGGVGAVTSLKTDRADGAEARGSSTSDAAAQSRKLERTPQVQIDEVTQQPVPPRFPWLSRLAAQLEAASKQRATFPAAPVLGDNLDKTA